MKDKSLWAVTIIAIVIGIFVGFFHIHNSDIWWHIAWGQQMLQQQTIFPAADFFYFTPISTDYLRELPNTFLGDIGLALLFRWGGTVSLQFLVLFCLVIGAYFIFAPWKDKIEEDKKWIPLVLLLFIAFCMGTCQLQIVRNSIISLAFFPLTLRLYKRHTYHEGWKLMMAYIPLFLIWSWIHPSYLLGLLALLLLYGGDLLENFYHSFSTSITCCKILFMLMLLLLVTLTYSWQPRQLLTTSITHAASSLTHYLKKAPHSSSFEELKITQPLWGKSTSPLSGDFIPTWKVMHHPAAWSSMLLAFAAWLSLLFYRGPHKIGFLGILALTTYFGCCYLRGTGYLTIVSIFILTSVFTVIEFRPKRLSTIIPRASILLVLITFTEIINLTFFRKSEFFFKEKSRIFGIGKAAVFDNAVYNFAETHFLDAPCFTTIVTGSYASLLWKEQKKVFIDSFFAPHSKELWRDYNDLLQQQDDSLLNRYHASIALVENSRLDWQSFFLNAPTWRPIALGRGVTLYGKRDLIPTETPVEILFDRTDVISSAPTEQRALASAYYNSILSLQLHHLPQAATATIKYDETLFETLATYLDPQQQGNIRLEPPGIKPVLLQP